MIRLIDRLPEFFAMYFLEKLCRICVQTGAPLVDIDTVDFDLVRLSEKLEVFANLAISKDVISSEICEKCVNKLRVSYHFLDMCKKSTNIIQGYLAKLDKREDNVKISPCYSTFESCELTVEVEKLQEYNEVHVDTPNALLLSPSRNSSLKRRQRITKEQRCSLLKQLLNKPQKERDKSLYCPNNNNNSNKYDYNKGGLKNIIDFTKNYEFSFNLDKNSNIESTPLDKLTAFSTNYFRRDFSEFKTHILYVIENQHNFDCANSNFGSDDEDYTSDESDERRELTFEEVMVEPDIKSEVLDGEDDEGQCPLDYLETSFEEEEEHDEGVKVKKEECHSDSENNDSNSHINLSNFFSTVPVKEELPISQKLDYKSSLSIDSSPAVKLLDRLVASYPIGSRKVFSPSNVRCRTRDQPYINPMLKNQFLYRSFKCERCNRYFKSQGYLKAHTSKVH